MTQGKTFLTDITVITLQKIEIFFSSNYLSTEYLSYTAPQHVWQRCPDMSRDWDQCQPG